MAPGATPESGLKVTERVLQSALQGKVPGEHALALRAGHEVAEQGDIAEDLVQLGDRREHADDVDALGLEVDRAFAGCAEHRAFQLAVPEPELALVDGIFGNGDDVCSAACPPGRC